VAALERKEVNMLAISTGSAPRYGSGNVKFLVVTSKINDIPELTKNAPTIYQCKNVTKEQADRICTLITGYRCWWAPSGMDPALEKKIADALVALFDSDEYRSWAKSVGYDLEIHSGIEAKNIFTSYTKTHSEMLDFYKANLR
jgi:hypothetical protein